MTSRQRPTRRSFLKAATVAAIAAPYFIRDLRAAPPSETVRHASFGAGGMAGADLRAIASHPNAKLTCVADVDAGRGEALKKELPEIRVYQDWRELLDKEAKNLDSVNVSTPDHMHAPIAASAMQLGLATYCQKPLTHDVYESRRLAEIAREKKVVTQMGIQVHSSIEYRMAVRLVQDGAIGPIKEVHSWSNKKWGDPSPRPHKSDPVPASLNWDQWLGVCAERPFIGGGYYHPGNWRKRLDFGTGTFGDMGCHIYDPVFEALGVTSPTSVRSEGPKPNDYNWANDAIVHYTFPATKFTEGQSVSVTWYDGDQKPPKSVTEQLGKQALPGQGSLFIGAKGLLLLPHVAAPILLPEDQFKEYQRPELSPANHWHQFVEAIRGNGKTSAGFDYAGPLTEVVLLGGVASRYPEQTLEWDGPGLKFTNVAEANELVRRTYRKGWEVAGLSEA
ncbi:MAG TPA: Gfo/Idh/MocA family oxidoreductase [Pirellulaceae bacterium]|nr:Gfo/Idh/MocA family oxidoreductase [Pirellulaceae bacterium]